MEAYQEEMEEEIEANIDSAFENRDPIPINIESVCLFSPHDTYHNMNMKMRRTAEPHQPKILGDEGSRNAGRQNQIKQ